MRCRSLALSALCCAWSSIALAQTSPLEDLDRQLTQLVTRLRKCIVHVTVQPSAAELRSRGAQEGGDLTITMSGVAMSADGLIATVADPLLMGERYVVRFADGSQRKAVMVSVEEEVGIGYLRVGGEQLEVPTFASELPWQPARSWWQSATASRNRRRPASVS
jgi:hypothetical protein